MPDTDEKDEKRGWVYKLLFTIAASLISLLVTVLLYVMDARIKSAEAAIEKKADASDVQELRLDIRDIRLMMTDHITDSGSGSVYRKGKRVR